jgi:accessory gene regulator protein AgrB
VREEEEEKEEKGKEERKRRRKKERFSIMFLILWFLTSIIFTKSKTSLRNHISEAA